MRGQIMGQARLWICLLYAPSACAPCPGNRSENYTAPWYSRVESTRASFYVKKKSETSLIAKIGPRQGQLRVPRSLCDEALFRLSLTQGKE
jgi:hypothetical protein